MGKEFFSVLMAAGASNGELGKIVLPLLLTFVAFYFILVRPEQKRKKEHEGWLKTLKKGDEVVTNGGLIGKIVGVGEVFVTLEPQEKVRMRVLLSGIAGKSPLQKNESKDEAKPA